MTARQKAQVEEDAKQAELIPFKDPQLGEYENERIFQEKFDMYLATLEAPSGIEEMWDERHGRKSVLQRELKVKPMGWAGGGNANEVYNKAAYNRQKTSDLHYKALKPALRRRTEVALRDKI